jgi:peptidoglycan/LPS O-acetylase OafA/YrhL
VSQPGSAANGFDHLRLIAAALVVVHHVRVLNGAAPWMIGWGPDPLGPDLGTLGVGIFFVISGYLVTASLRRTPGVGAFLAKRVLRIAPGLLAALLLTAFVLGPLVSGLPVADYFGGAAPLLYVLNNLSLYAVTYELPGVFSDAPYPDVVNGSLWSLRLEFTAYLGLAALGALRLVRAPVLAGLALLAGGAFMVVHFTGLDARGDLARLASLATLNGWLFLCGAALEAFRAKPPAWTATIGLALLPTPAWFLGLPLAVVALGRMTAPRLPADLSYGLYIYSFPLQQVLAEHGRLNVLTSLALTLPFAAVSWFLVEKPTLRLKARLPGALSPAPAPVDQPL